MCPSACPIASYTPAGQSCAPVSCTRWYTLFHVRVTVIEVVEYFVHRTSVLWLKKEFRHLTSPEDVDKESDEKISPDDKKFFKENFLNHLEYETSVPSEEDKKFVARIYYKGELL